MGAQKDCVYKKLEENILLASLFLHATVKPILMETRMWANAQRDGRTAEYRWRPLLNAAKFD